MGEQGVLGGAITLMGAAALSRALGAVAHIVLPRLMGAEAMGLLQMAYPVYSVFLAVALAGVPLAISRLVAEELAAGRGENARQILKVALRLLFTSGLGLALGLFWGAEPIARRILKDAAAAGVLKAIAPGLFFLPLNAGLRGYFHGHQEMFPSAAAQVVEQCLRVTAMIGLAAFLAPQGREAVATGAALGTAVSSAAGLAALLFFYWFRQPPRTRSRAERAKGKSAPLPPGQVLARLWRLALPTTLATVAVPLINALDAAIVPRRLQELGYSLEVTRRLYGQLSGMAMALVYFPTIVTLSLSSSLVPAVAQAVAWRDRRLLHRRFREALEITFLWSVPCAAGLYVLAAPIAAMLFGDAGPARPLVFLAPGIIFLCLQETTTGLLQGLGRPLEPVKNFLLASLLKGAATYFLTGFPALGVLGAALGTVLGFAAAALLNLASALRYGSLPQPPVGLVLRPLTAAALMAALVRSTYLALEAGWLMATGVSHNTLSTLVSILMGALTYAGALAALGGLPPYLVQALERIWNGRGKRSFSGPWRMGRKGWWS
ncbi:MAG: oligosaccharide flippase family protein [Bacillota bacterium]|nr:oligosaccharide flippase family protein [Bacillota bacterium]